MSRSDTPSFVLDDSGFHPTIDTHKLAVALAGTPIPNEARDRIVGPHDFFALSECRKLHSVESEQAIPADYFLMGVGEPRHRAATKLGGLPYLPAKVPWPERDGTFGDFYAQLNFADSRDIVPHAQGDVLLVFRFHDLDCTSWDEELYECIWVNLGDQELVAPEDVGHSAAGANDPWPPLHGYRLRTFDDPSQTQRLVDEDAGAWDLHSGHATKVGGQATDAQRTWGPRVPGDFRFLGQVVATWPEANVVWPVVNREAPVAWPSEDYDAMVSGPGDGITCFYLDGRGRVRVHFSCA